MATLTMDIVRVINAPIDAVFARLANISDNSWMTHRSILSRTEVTSDGEFGVGSTYIDHTPMGPYPGDIAEFETPSRIVFHWRELSRKGKLTAEGWPSYTLEAIDENSTRVTHSPKLTTYGIYRLATPVYGVIMRVERTGVMRSLQKSFA